MSSSHRLLKSVRLIHLYLGVFIAPMLLFFSFTGFVQTFSLHETLKGRDYTPPAILVKLGQLHKKQTLIVPARKAAPPPAAQVGERHGGGEGDGKSDGGPRPQRPTDGGGAPQPNKPLWSGAMWAMKLFFGLVAVGLMTSTLTGIYMSYKYVRNRFAVTGMLVAGVVVPLALLAL